MSAPKAAVVGRLSGQVTAHKGAQGAVKGALRPASAPKEK